MDRLVFCTIDFDFNRKKTPRRGCYTHIPKGVKLAQCANTLEKLSKAPVLVRTTRHGLHFKALMTERAAEYCRQLFDDKKRVRHDEIRPPHTGNTIFTVRRGKLNVTDWQVWRWQP